MKLIDFFEEIPVKEWGIDPQTEAEAVSSDSRKMRPGDIFVCLVGRVFDGRKYIPAAFEKGAVVAVTEEKPEGDYPYVLVSDARAALPKLLSRYYNHPERSFSRIIGITGTNGKTTTSFMLKTVFEQAGHKTGLIGTTKYLVGNEEYPVDPSAAFLTTPDPELLYALFAAMRDAGCDTVIMETSSHALALRKLAGIPFDIGIFTNLTQDHIDFHETMEEYLAAKKKLFQVAKVGIFNGDDPSLESLLEGLNCKKILYSMKSQSEVRCREVYSHTDRGIRYALETPQWQDEIRLAVSGQFNIYNSLAAVSCALECGISPSVIKEALGKMTGVKGRIERVPTDTPFSVMIDFAHTPDALENILSTLRGFTEKRLITLFGCGGDRDRTKRPIMGEIACRMSDFVIITSDNSRSEKTEDIMAQIEEGARGAGCEYVSIADRKKAIHYALDLAKKGDVILLAGKGHEEYEIDQNGKHEFSERKIVQEYIGEIKK